MDSRRGPCRDREPPAGGGVGASAVLQALRSSAVEGAAASVRQSEAYQCQLQDQCAASLRKSDKSLSNTVHPQLRMLLSRALARMSTNMFADKRALDECLCDVSEALLQADFHPQMVLELKLKLKKNIDAMLSGSNRSVQQVLCKELCKMVDSGAKPSFVPKKGKPCVVMVIGHQGSGKTTSCAKFGYHHKQKGYKPSIVCTDTRAGSSLDYLNKIAREVHIPVYGSNFEDDPVRVAVQGVHKFKQEKSDLIIVDTSVGATSKHAFPSEIHKVQKATNPDLIVLVVDAGDGRSAYHLVESLKNTSIGSAIVSKMDHHPNGGGTLSALAAASCPVIFYGTGKYLESFEVFDVKAFTNNLLDYKPMPFILDFGEIHNLIDNLKVSEVERKNALLEVERKCLDAYTAALEEHRLLIEQICSSETEYDKICDILGEQELKTTKFKSVSSLEERKKQMMINLKPMVKEKIERTKKLKVLLSRALDLCDILGETTRQRVYKSMMENLSSSLQEANSLSSKFLEKLAKEVKALEVEAKHDILRRSKMFIRGTEECTDLASLEELMKAVVTWESQQKAIMLHEKENLMARLKMAKVMMLSSKFGSSGRREANGDADMGHLTSSSSSESRSDSKDPDYMPDSTESDIDMRELVVSESSDSVSS